MSIPGAASPLFIGAAAAAEAGYQIDRSLRFDVSSSSYLNRTPSSAGNRKTYTFSTWLKRASLVDGFLLSVGSFGILFENNEMQISFTIGSAGGTHTDMLFRDPSAWYHCVIAIDTTQSTAADRVKLYVNGTQITSFRTTNYPSQGSDTPVNDTVSHSICRKDSGGGASFFSGYLAETHFIDGQQLAASDFGEYDDNNVWQPKEYSGSYGTNGFYLKFDDNSSSSALGTDSSGNSNTYTVNNLSVASGSGNDSLIDTPTNYTASGNNGGNYCTMNPLTRYAAALANGNLEVTGNRASDWSLTIGTIGITSGKFYWEYTVDTVGSTQIGICQYPSNDKLGADAKGYGYILSNGKIDHNNTDSVYGNSLAAGDVLGIAYDADGGNLYFYKNGTIQNSGTAAATGIASATWFPGISIYGNSSPGKGDFNFGQRPFAISSIPTGYSSLVTTNLSDPTIADGSTAMDIKLYTGNGSTQTISGLGFSPDLVWLKVRNTTYSHYLTDTVRGATKDIYTNATNAEGTDANGLTAFTSDGFTLGTDVGRNESAKTYVGWAWDAGTSTVSNTDGSITSSVRANASAGFSIVGWTGTSANGTIGHGLNAAPEFVIVKKRGGTGNWYCYHKGLTDATKYILLNSTAAEGTQTAAWNSTAPTSTVVHLGAEPEMNANTVASIAYCFAPVAGYSAFGSYTGNGSADGPFAFTGMRAKLILLRSTSSGDWFIIDTERDPANGVDNYLFPNGTNAESSVTDFIDILSNGFKYRYAGGGLNTTGHTIIYAAFAEHPFKTARAR